MSLRIPASTRDAMHAHLRAAYPEEGCGVMLGTLGADARAVERVIAIDNQREDSRHNRYLISPEQFLAADREARAQGLEVIGFYHSHPDHPARPSGFDLEHAWPYYSYVIVSVVRGEPVDTRSWRLAEDRSEFEAEPIETAADTAPRTESKR